MQQICQKDFRRDESKCLPGADYWGYAEKVILAELIQLGIQELAISRPALGCRG